MKKIILTLLFAVIVQFSFGQNSFPTLINNPQWNVLECNYGMAYVCYTYNYQYEYDTTYCGYNYSKIITNNPNPYEYNAYIRVDSQKVYLRKNNICSDKEYLLYDFSLNVGDTAICGIQLNYFTIDGDTSKFWVNEIDTVNYFGKDRKRLKMSYYLFSYIYSMNWIEGIGSDISPFYSLACLWDGCESSYSLLCYDSSGIQLFQNPFFLTCDTTITGIKDFNIKDQIKESIYPNPFQETINVEFEIKDKGLVILEIYSIIGKKLETEVYNNQGTGKLKYVIGNELEKGIYILKLCFDNKKIYKKIIKL